MFTILGCVLGCPWWRDRIDVLRPPCRRRCFCEKFLAISMWPRTHSTNIRSWRRTWWWKISFFSKQFDTKRPHSCNVQGCVRQLMKLNIFTQCMLHMRIHCVKHLMSDVRRPTWMSFECGMLLSLQMVAALAPMLRQGMAAICRRTGRGESKECEVVTVFETMDMTLEKFLKDFGRLGDLNCCLAERTATSSGDHRSCILNQIWLGHIWLIIYNIYIYENHIIWSYDMWSYNMIIYDLLIDDLLYAETFAWPVYIWDHSRWNYMGMFVFVAGMLIICCMYSSPSQPQDLCGSYGKAF